MKPTITKRQWIAILSLIALGLVINLAGPIDKVSGMPESAPLADQFPPAIDAVPGGPSFVTVLGMDFQATTYEPGYPMTPLILSDPDGGDFYALLYLPDQSSINKAVFYYKDNDHNFGKVIQVRVRAINLYTGDTTDIASMASDTADPNYQYKETTTITNGIVDNSRYAY